MGYQVGIENEALEGRIADRVRGRRRKRRRESTVEQRSVDHAKALGWQARKMNGLGFRHWPDRYFIPPKVPTKALRSPGRGAGGRHLASYTPRQVQRRRGFWVEFKKPSQPPTRAQADLHADLRARGEHVYVVDTDEGFVRILRDEHACLRT